MTLYILTKDIEGGYDEETHTILDSCDDIFIAAWAHLPTKDELERHLSGDIAEALLSSKRCVVDSTIYFLTAKEEGDTLDTIWA